MTVTLKSKLQKSQKKTKKNKKKNMFGIVIIIEMRPWETESVLYLLKHVTLIRTLTLLKTLDLRLIRIKANQFFWELCERLRFIIQSNFKNTFLYSMKRIFIGRLKDLDIFSSFEIPYHQTMNQQGTLLKQGLF